MKKIKIKPEIKQEIANRKKIAQQKLKRIFGTGIGITLSVAGIGIASIVLVFALYIIISSPNFDKELLYSEEATVLYSKDEKEMARIGSENRVLVTYDDLPQVLVDALIATEDSRFFQHNGLDGARFIVASIGQFLGQSSSGGASTLSMQVIKNTYTSSTSKGIKGIVRKFTDIYMSVFKLESNYTKEEIIEFYVNSQWLGYDGNLNYSGIYGVEQASQYYFGKSVSDLTLAEASMLVGMFQNPTLYNPYKNPNTTAKRRSTVLRLMLKHGYITKDQQEAVEAISVQSLLRKQNTSTKSPYQAFIDYVVKDVQNKTGENPLKTPMAIYTTLDPNIQSVLTQLENEEIYTFPNEKLQMGVAITSISDGSILALSGGRDYAAKGLNRATDIKRQPGSTAKIIFDYGPYIEYLNGSTYSMFLDDPYSYSNGRSIRNHDNSYMGLMTMRTALVKSRNIPALQAFQTVYKENPNYIIDFVHSLGINYGDNLYESAAIGGFDGTNPLEMSAAYSAYARGGYYIKPYSFTKIVYNDETIYEDKYIKNRVMNEETAYMITSMLVTGGKSGVGGSLNVSGTDIAAKGGTTTVDEAAQKELNLPSNITPDHWNITYSPDYCIALWVGYDSMNEKPYLTTAVGGNARRTIMSNIGKKIYKKNSTFTKPSGVVSVAVELETFPAQLASKYTPSNLITNELFKKGTEPSEVSTRFSELSNPTNGLATNNGQTIKLTWDAINTPDAVSTSYLQQHFNTYYKAHAAKYYQKRLTYNSSYIGNIGYQVYLKNSNGELTSLGFTTNNYYIYALSNSTTTEYTFVVKSAYSIFKANMSSGIIINTSIKTDSNVDDMINNPDNNLN